MAEETQAGQGTPNTGEGAEAPENKEGANLENLYGNDEETPNSEENKEKDTTGEKETPNEGEEEEEKPAEGAPEKYEDFTLPEGFEADTEQTEKFQGLAKELDLSQEKAQKVVDYYAEVKKQEFEQSVKRVNDIHGEWDKSLKDEWGKGYEENCSHVAKALDGAPKEFMDLLQGNDKNFPVVMADHPAVAKYLAEIGKRMGEQPLEVGETKAPKDNRSPEDIMYGTTDIDDGRS